MLLYQPCVSPDVECWHPGSFTCGTRILPVLPATDVCLLPLLNPSWTSLSLCRSVWKPTSKILPPCSPHLLTLAPLHHLSPFTLPPLHPLTLHTGTSPPPHPSHYYFSILLPQSSGPGPLQHVQTVGPGIGFTSTSPLPQSTGTPSPFHYGPAHRYTMAQVVTHTSQNRAPGSPTKPSPMVSELTLFPGLQSQLTGWKAW